MIVYIMLYIFSASTEINMGDETPNQEFASFNSAAEYCKSLIIIERSIADSFLKQEYYNANEGMEILWMELAEWMSEDEIKEHDVVKKLAFEACSRINIAKKNGRNSVDTQDIEILKSRNMMLKKIIHKYGLRMQKVDDISGVPILSRPARYSPNRHY